MKLLLTIVFLSLASIAMAGADSYIHAYMQADRLHKSGDASSLSSNPFQSIALYHQVAILPQSPAFLPCRIRCSVPLRLEYYDAGSQVLLAIDANGNGNLTDEGDLHLVSKDGLAAAMLPLPAGMKHTTLKVKVYSIDGKAPNPSGEEILLTTEVFRDTQWVTESISKLR